MGIQKDDTSKVNTLINLSQYIALADFKKRAHYAQQALLLAQNLGFKKGQGEAYLSIAFVHTQQSTGHGTGLGLFLSYDIIRAHGGEIKVETRDGEGAEFIIRLPVA